MPRPKFWPQGHFGLEDLTLLATTKCCTMVRQRHYQLYYHVVVLWYITVYHGLPWMATRYYHVVLPRGLTMVIPCGIPWCNRTMACCVIGLQPTTASFFDCRNCRPMYSAGMWRRFSVAGTQRSAISENCLTSTSAQHPPCFAMSVCKKAHTKLITK